MLMNVTITGADDSVRPADILKLSQRYPFVEWGILVSGKGTMSRFPSPGWQHKLVELLELVPAQLSLHICGRWVRDICQGKWDEVIVDSPLFSYVQRVQLNFHCYQHLLTPDFVPQAKRALGNKQVIFQCDGVNDVLVLDAQEQGLNAVPLFDKSGGAGILPGDWPLALFNIVCGYAGGLGPENVQRQLHNIKQASRSQPFWIDMERRVRSADDAVLDLAACERVLELCSSEFSAPLE